MFCVHALKRVLSVAVAVVTIQAAFVYKLELEFGIGIGAQESACGIHCSTEETPLPHSRCRVSILSVWKQKGRRVHVELKLMRESNRRFQVQSLVAVPVCMHMHACMHAWMDVAFNWRH